MTRRGRQTGASCRTTTRSRTARPVRKLIAAGRRAWDRAPCRAPDRPEASVPRLRPDDGGRSRSRRRRGSRRRGRRRSRAGRCGGGVRGDRGGGARRCGGRGLDRRGQGRRGRGRRGHGRRGHGRRRGSEGGRGRRRHGRRGHGLCGHGRRGGSQGGHGRRGHGLRGHRRQRHRRRGNRRDRQRREPVERTGRPGGNRRRNDQDHAADDPHEPTTARRPNRFRASAPLLRQSMRLEQDYYDVLGVAPGATDEEIKKAFRGLARRLHPDVAEAAPGVERFHDVVAAYRVLSHPKRRSLYDRLGLGGRRAARRRARRSPRRPRARVVRGRARRREAGRGRGDTRLRRLPRSGRAARGDPGAVRRVPRRGQMDTGLGDAGPASARGPSVRGLRGPRARRRARVRRLLGQRADARTRHDPHPVPRRRARRRPPRRSTGSRSASCSGRPPSARLPRSCCSSRLPRSRPRSACLPSCCCARSRPRSARGELRVHGLRPEAGAVLGGQLLELEPEDLLERGDGVRADLVDGDGRSEPRGRPS